MSLKDSLRIMVVDDMSVSRGLLTQALEEIGIWKVDAQNSGETALGKLVASPVHLVISDYNMPGMDGLQLLQALRSNRSTQQIGFILVTGTPTPEIIEAGRRIGLNNLVKKPFTTAGLKQSIEAVVGRL
ncbi:response regulator [Wenxinia saemankumensis]|uniref:Response regulator receiver protein n=1 Tax=Wenxinia saemankumensis TaxID=1447782 RepID=A0A1M6DQK9_9RHOB|nr:response regulator [Wenxinia saemankumensis]SHI75485.1 response regulator receiver protein [Wenxinia saemankumensis]